MKLTFIIGDRDEAFVCDGDGHYGTGQLSVWVKGTSFWVTHTGQPMNFRGQMPWNEDMADIVRLVVEAPAELQCVGFPFNGSNLIERRYDEDGTPTTDVWEVLKDAELRGGQTYHWQLVESLEIPTTQDETRVDLKRLPMEFHALELGPAALQHMSRCLELWSPAEDSTDRTKVERDIFWRMIPENWELIGGVADDVRGWDRAGDVHWGDGFSNCHYHAELWPMLFSVIYPEDPRAPLARRLGLWMTKQKAGMGMIWTPNNQFEGAWVYEKGFGRRGDAFLPSSYKEWDLGLMVAHILDPQDVFILQALQKRREYWLRMYQADLPGSVERLLYRGRWGSRAFARVLANLKSWVRFEESPWYRSVYREIATEAMRQAFSWVDAGNPWFQDGKRWVASGNKYWAPWMCAQAVVEADWWMRELGLEREYETKLRMVCERLVGFLDVRDDGFVEVPQYVTGYPVWEATHWGHPSLNAWMWPALKVAERLKVPMMDNLLIGVERTGYEKLGCVWSNIHDEPRLSLAGGDLGAATTKIHAAALSSLLA